MKILNDDLELNKKENEDENQGSDVEGVDDRAMCCFLEAGLDEGTLRAPIEEKECTFLVNMINGSNSKTIPYEQFIDFVIP